MTKLALAFLVALLTTACLGSDAEDSLLGTWELIEGEVDGQTLQLVPSHPATLTFAEGVFGGTASCNGYGGVYRRDQTTVEFSELSITEAACSPSAVMTLESAFIDGLVRTDTLLQTETLSLTGDGVRLTFEKQEPVPDAELTGSVWVLDTLIQGDAATSVSGERATLEFFTDGSVIGGTGCRLFSGQYQISGADVVITDLTSDGPECEPEIAPQDSHVISALEGNFRVEIDGNRMTTWTQGDEGLGYTADD